MYTREAAAYGDYLGGFRPNSLCRGINLGFIILNLWTKTQLVFLNLNLSAAVSLLLIPKYNGRRLKGGGLINGAMDSELKAMGHS